MRTTISKHWHFDAAHQLPNHDGKCRRPHGHTYTVTLAVSGEPQPLDGRAQEGMVVDFGELDRVWKSIEPQLDHQDLNVTVGPIIGRTTSERLAEYLFGVFTIELSDSCEVESVRVSETAHTYAEVRA